VSLSVYSEIGPLREVLVHSPGEEVDVMPPSMMQELLFDDIIYGPRARMEHARFCAILEKLGVKVVDT
jgi:arginine deiminase